MYISTATLYLHSRCADLSWLYNLTLIGAHYLHTSLASSLRSLLCSHESRRRRRREERNNSRSFNKPRHYGTARWLQSGPRGRRVVLGSTLPASSLHPTNPRQWLHPAPRRQRPRCARNRQSSPTSGRPLRINLQFPHHRTI